MLATALLLGLAGCSERVAGTPAAIAPASGLSCPGPATAAIVSCLRQSLREFWTKELDRPVDGPVVVNPVRTAVPRDCRAALDLQTAFTCPTDNRIYLTDRFVARLRAATPLSDGWYRLAATLSHEMGHVVQVDEHVPGVRAERPSAAQSQRIEQQADCLSGVWAHAVGLNGRRFLRAAAQVYRIIDSPFERRTHGDPDERIAAINRGRAGGDPKACGVSVG